jgi:hypothetical protein
MANQSGGKNRFFPNGLKKGDPISKRGFVEGIIKIADALDKISVHNGHIDWTGDVPKIIIDRFTK